MESEPDAIAAKLDAIEARLGECRAAVAVAAEGDPDVLKQLGEEVDAMARDVAELKAAVSGPGLAG
ncbi:MAG TPA: hypothetical protein VFN38_15645 [Gemmatimonadaceae bacterium]|nr:hypothetical protein [Gemmatimonadaceae bacterium]